MKGVEMKAFNKCHKKREVIKKIEDFLIKELSYDGEADEKCPYCHKILQKGRVWLYHWESMCGNLGTEMGFGNKVVDLIEEVVRDYCPSGNKKEDAQDLAKLIYEIIYE